MGRVTIADKSLLIDGRPVYLRSGEMSYFRTPADSWKDRLEKSQRCHLNCISTYIPWFWHEPAEGTFDFTGSRCPETNLVRYLDEIAESGLYAFVRPGPFINSEMRYGGHPEWLFRNHPEVWSHDAEGKLAVWLGHGTPVPSQLHPKYLEIVGRWYEQVIPILARYSIEKGGPVILSQPDNEMNLIYTFSVTQSLYDEHVIGDGKRQGLWHEWLLREYGDWPAIRARYGGEAASLAAVQPPRRAENDEVSRRKILDWLEFKVWHIFAFAEHLVKLFYRHDLTVPFTMNEPNCFVMKGGDHAAASEYFRRYEGQYFTTGHLYLGGGEQDILGVPMTLYRIELVKLLDLAGPTVEGEIGLGWCDLTRNRAVTNFDLLTRLALGHGMDGYNFYMFSGGTNPPGSNSYGRDYNWNAPIQPDGSLDPTFDQAARFGKWVQGWEPQIVNTEKEFDFYLAISTDLSYQAQWIDRTEVLSPEAKGVDIYGHATFKTDASHDAYDSILEIVRIMTTFQLQFKLLNLFHLPQKPIADKPLIVPTSGRLPREAFAFLRARIEKGIPVVFYPTLPCADLDGNVQKDFLDFLGLSGLEQRYVPIPGMEPFRTRFLTVDSPVAPEVAVDRGVRTFSGYGDAEVLASHEGRTVALKKRVGDGTVVLMGLYPSYLTHDSQRMFHLLLADSIALTPQVKSQDGILHAVIRKRTRDDACLLTVANILGSPSATRIDLDLNGKRLTFPQLTKLEVQPKSIFNFWINLDLGYARLLYSTVELYPENKERTVFTTRGDRLTDGELAFDRPVHIEVDGTAQTCTARNGMHIVTMTHGKGESTLRIRSA